MDNPISHTGNGPADDAGLSTREIIGSACAAAFGVQSRENKQRDFNRGKPLQFILAGLILTAGLMLILVTVVTLVL